MKKLVLMLMLMFSMVSCVDSKNKEVIQGSKQYFRSDFNFDVDPETFNLKVEVNGVIENVSDPIDTHKVTNLKKEKDKVSWSYEDEGIDVVIEDKNDYLDVSIKSTMTDENNFSWPKVSGDEYILPIGEGKLIPSNDETWKKYFGQIGEIKGIEGLSMQMFGVNKKDYSLVYIIENPYNNTLSFDTNDLIDFTFSHEFPSINNEKEYGFRIYVTDKNVTDIAKTYRNYMIGQGKFKTLKDKEKENSNIKKLYGAPHVYFWNSNVIAKDNIKWNQLKDNFPSDLENWIKKLLKEHVEDGEDLISIFDEMKTEEYVSEYIKNGIINVLSNVLKLRELYNSEIFTDSIDFKSELDKGVQNLNDIELIEFNKKLLKSKLKDMVDPIDKWANSLTTDVLEDMKNSGLSNLVINFDDWRTGFMKPELVENANKYGYLIGTYDSYHSIHKPGEEQWITAAFEDETLFETATVTNKDGEKIEGFNGVGRKLNPTLAMPSVRSRVGGILDTGVNFNTWFLDTDGTGEVFDDYSKEHITTEEQDINGRIERVKYLTDDKDMVVGTEGGNDFINPYVAFSHGIEMGFFQWMDKDQKDKNSEYYFGQYYSPTGGVAKMFSKQVPLKDYFREIFFNGKYSIPLYKLVYNDSVVTTYWWGNGTLKFVDDIETRMLYEVLYNIPSIYHIDSVEWEKHKDTIVKHYNVWSEFSKKVINNEMTEFKNLTDDGSIKLTKYGDDIKVIANFSDESYIYEGKEINAKSLLISDNGSIIEYTPKV